MDDPDMSSRLSALEHAIWTEKQKIGSILEVALRLLLDEETVRHRLRVIAAKLADGAMGAGPAADGSTEGRPASVA